MHLSLLFLQHRDKCTGKTYCCYVKRCREFTGRSGVAVCQQSGLSARQIKNASRERLAFLCFNSCAELDQLPPPKGEMDVNALRILSLSKIKELINEIAIRLVNSTYSIIP